jgi:hypothetical protein
MNGNVTRLQEQLNAYNQVKQHIQRRSIDELEFYPAHDKRLETKEYKAVHNKLVKDQDRPCLVCGVTDSIIKDPIKKDSAKLNPFGATQLETHHHIIEWALQNAIDVDRFNKTLRLNLARRHPDNPQYKGEMTAKEVADWVDHSEDNLWVLCDVHHRARYLGIHEITYPIWSPMDLLRGDFESWVLKEIKSIDKLPK